MKIAAISLAFLLLSANAQQPVRISAGVMAGQLVHKVMPQFPDEAARAHVNGSVVMHVLIGEDGTVKEVTPVSGPEMLRQPYMDALRQWIYWPYLVNGRPVPVDTTIAISINMGAPDAQQPHRIHISSGELAGQNLQHPYPTYKPEESVSGSTVFQVVIGKDGRVQQATAIAGPLARRQSDLDAVKQWTYKPYLLNGEPTEVESTITLHPDFGH